MCAIHVNILTGKPPRKSSPPSFSPGASLTPVRKARTGSASMTFIEGSLREANRPRRGPDLHMTASCDELSLAGSGSRRTPDFTCSPSPQSKADDGRGRSDFSLTSGARVCKICKHWAGQKGMGQAWSHISRFDVPAETCLCQPMNYKYFLLSSLKNSPPQSTSMYLCFQANDKWILSTYYQTKALTCTRHHRSNV